MKKHAPLPATAMPRRRIAMRLMENARARATTYAKRAKGLQKMASELATLCDVPVALVCAPGAGAGSRIVWESKEGVLDRYRAAAFPPETRARHTHRSYLEAELGKERAKLARLRQGGASHGALADWDPALNDMTLDTALEVLGTIDAALRAAGDRMVALGLLADGRLEPELAAAPNDASADATGVAPLLLAPDMDMGYAGFQQQTMPCHGGNNGGGGLLEHFLMQPEYGLECVDGNYDAGTVEETHGAGGCGDNADCRWPDMTMCYPADGSWDAVVPVGYYPEFADGALAPEHYYSAEGATGGDYADTLPLEYPMGMDGNLACLDMDNSYMVQWQAQEFQRSDNGTEQYQYQCSDLGTRSSGQLFHYLY